MSVHDVGWNDPQGNVFCSFCAWTEKATTIEQVEFRLNRHLKEAHNKCAVRRTSESTGRVVDIPR